MNRYRVALSHMARSWRGIVEAHNVDAAIAKAKSAQDFPERATSETQRLDDVTAATIDGLIAALMRALPFVEDARDDKGYKVGAVDAAIAEIRKALKSAGAL